MTSQSTKYIPYAGSTSKKFFLGLELPNEVSLASKRPLVTPKRCGSHKNDRDPPWSQVFSLFQVAFSQFVRMLKVGVVRDLCTGTGITWDSGSSGFQGRMGARTIPSAQINQFQGASHGTAKNTSPIVAQPARSRFRKSDPQNDYESSPPMT